MSTSAPTWPATEPTNPAEVARALETLYDAHGQTYYDESVTQTEHALQTSALAQREGASEALIIASLLHDIGHLMVDEHAGQQDFLDTDEEHERIGMGLLGRWFPAEVTEPIALHVAAKRYLVATDSTYKDTLSQASIRSLAVQGGPMSPDEVTEFRASGHAEDACRLRRWDDRAKVAGQSTPAFSDYLPMLERVVRLPS